MERGDERHGEELHLDEQTADSLPEGPGASKMENLRRIEEGLKEQVEATAGPHGARAEEPEHPDEDEPAGG